MKKLLIAAVVATIAAAAVCAAARQRESSVGSVAAPGAGNSSRSRRIQAPGAAVANIVEEAIETSAGDLSGAPTDDGATPDTETG